MAASPRKSDSDAGRYYSDRLTLRVQPALPQAIERAAAKQFTTPCEYIRRSLIDRLRLDGIDPAGLALNSEGAGTGDRRRLLSGCMNF
jgi:hypothetical protein